MKFKISALLAALCIPSVHATDLVITGVFDATLTGGTPKGVEIYAVNTVADLSACGIGSANNGGGTDGQEFTFPSQSVTAGSYLYAATEADNFEAFFGFAPDFIVTALGINGDDAVELFCNDNVIDTFGDIDVDGSGQAWEYLDGWAYRNAETGPDGVTFSLSNWRFSGVDALDGASSNATSATPFPLQAYTNGTDTPVIEEPIDLLAIGACAAPATLISAVQGDGESSPVINETHVVEGIVTASFDSLNAFFVQEESTDMDSSDLTSEGVFVSFNGTLPAAGNVVRVLGDVSEFFGRTQILATEVLADCGTATASVAELTLPFASALVPESMEGMLVSATQELVVSDNFGLGRFGEATLSSQRLYTPTNIHAPGSDEAIALQASNALDKITLDDANSAQNPDPVPFPSGGLSAANTLRAGDSVSVLTGVVDYSFSKYRVIPTVDPTFVQSNPRTDVPVLEAGNLTVASLNVLNYFVGIDNNGSICGPQSASGCRGADSDLEFERQKAKTVAAIVAMDADIVGLMEIENNGFAEGSAIQDLVDGINAEAGAGTYAIVDPGAPVGTDAITVALIYKPAVVALAGDVAILNSDNSITDESGALFDDGRNRPAIAQGFTLVANNEAIVVSVNHLKSKGSGCGDGDDDVTTGQGNCNLTRTRAASALSSFLATEFPDMPTLIIGDLNAYAKEDPITALEADGYTNLVNEFGGVEAYSYTFNGEAGYLDHALANASALAKTVDVAEWHINADEPISLDYNTEFKSDNLVMNYYAPDAYRMSDHDPVMVRMQLTSPMDEVEEEEDDSNDSSGGSFGVWALMFMTLFAVRRKFK